MENRLNVGITHGDVNGISYELIIKLLAENRICELCVPILYGSPKVAAYYRKVLNIENFYWVGLLIVFVLFFFESEETLSDVVECNKKASTYYH